MLVSFFECNLLYFPFPARKEKKAKRSWRTAILQDPSTLRPYGEQCENSILEGFDQSKGFKPRTSEKEKKREKSAGLERQRETARREMIMDQRASVTSPDFLFISPTNEHLSSF